MFEKVKELLARKSKIEKEVNKHLIQEIALKGLKKRKAIVVDAQPAYNVAQSNASQW